MEALRDLGAVVYRNVASGALIGTQELEICEHGFRARSTGLVGIGVRGAVSTAEASWGEVVAVRRIDQRVTVNGITTSDAVWVHVVLDSGKRFIFCGRRSDPMGPTSASALYDAAKDAAGRRVAADIDAGRPIAFGDDLRVTPLGIDVRKGSTWRTLRREDIAGFRLYNGSLMVDEDPARPRLFVQKDLSSLDNGDVFLDLVRRLAPGKDLDQVPYRVPGSVWRTSAASHVPGGLSARTKMLVFGLPLGLVAGFVLLGMVVRLVQMPFAAAAQRERERKMAAFREVAAAQAAALASAPAPTAPLLEACAGKGVDVDALSVVVTSPADLPGAFPDMTTLAFGTGEYVSLLLPKEKGVANLPLHDHLVVAHVLPGSAMAPKGVSHAKLSVRVMRAADQAVVCEGAVEGHWQARADDVRHGETRQPELARAMRNGLARLSIAGLCAGPASGACKEALEGRAWSDAFQLGALPEEPAPAPSASAKAGAPKARPQRPQGERTPAARAATPSLPAQAQPAPASQGAASSRTRSRR